MGSAFAVVRVGLAQGREATERLCGVIEESMRRQSDLLERMGADLREQNGLLSRMASIREVSK